MPPPPRQTFAEFFAGIGLMRMGLERAGWSIAYANDIDEGKHRMYRDHFGEGGEFILGDVHALDTAAIPEVDLATASFPCTDLSLAGGRKGLVGQHSSAFWGFIAALKNLGERRPRMVLLENVTGFLTSHGGRDFRDALVALNELGYAVDAFVVDAVRFVPQSRQRLFVVGARSESEGAARRLRSLSSKLDHGSHAAPQPLSPSEHRPAALADFIARHPKIDWRLRELPRLPRSQTKIRDILEKVPADAKIWWNPVRRDYLLNQMSPKHRALADAMIANGRVSYGTIFRRIRKGKSMAELRTDGIAGCLRTPRGGSARQILFAAGQGRFAIRLLTGRECARLMGADDFQLNVPLNRALFGFGDAVCVPVIEWIARNYLNPVWSEEIAGCRPVKAPRAKGR